MNTKYEPCSICEQYIEGVVCTQDECPVAKMKVENDRLKKDNEYILMQHKFQRRPSGDCWNDVIEKAKSEAIKEFAEAVKMEFYREFDEIIPSIMADRIDSLVKEMMEGEQC